MSDTFTVGNTNFSSRLLVGTGKFASYSLMREALEASRACIKTSWYSTVRGGYFKLYP